MTSIVKSQPTAGDRTVRIRTGLCVALACAAGLLMGAPAAHAEEVPTHVFDAKLSLTGNCETSSKDPIPDPVCPAEPSVTFPEVFGATTDSHGDIYYFGRPSTGAPEKAYVFDASGRFLSAFPESAPIEHVTSMAVDEDGNLYVSEGPSESLYLFRPTAYNPEAGEITYGNAPTPIGSVKLKSLVIDPATGRVFGIVPATGEIAEISSYAEGNSVLRTFGAGLARYPVNLAIDFKHERIYLSEAVAQQPSEPGIAVGDLAGNLLEARVGVETNSGLHDFSQYAQIGVAVDESTGHLFISDFQNNPKPAIYEVDQAGGPVSTIAHSFQPTNNWSAILVDNGVHSPNSSMNPDSPIAEEANPNGSYLFVPSGVQGTGHLYAFAPRTIPKPPAIETETVAGVSESEAVLQARINPKGLPTSYRFEYVSAAVYANDVEALGAGHGFDHAVVAGTGTLPAVGEGVTVSAPLFSLTPGTAYRFRAVAENACEGSSSPACSTAGDAVAFTTYAEFPVSSKPCPNQALRFGFSTPLPDCRAYELVTPADTNGHSPVAPNSNSAGTRFGTPPASAEGDAVGFMTIGGAIPGYPGAGGFNGDPYLATRTASGWQTASVGPAGTLATNPVPGAYSSDLRYTTWYIGPEDSGELAVSFGATYIHYPDGLNRLVGEGSIGTDLQARPVLIAEGAAHVLFTTVNFGGSTAVQLEPQAPPSGTGAIYDRTPDGVLHVVSLLPGDVTPAAGENASYEGTSSDGSVVAFRIHGGGPLYLRLDDERTVEAAGPGAVFQGLSKTGRFLFYIASGDLYRYDTESEVADRITENGNVTVVNISADGTGVYFASGSVIATGPNPNGAEPVASEANLYFWDGATVDFVATVSARDMEGESFGSIGGGSRDGLGLWQSAISASSTATDPSRTTPSGGTFVFESNANIAGYESGGASEIYRYDAVEGTLRCLSCNPTQVPASGNARLQTVRIGNESAPPAGAFAVIPSLVAGGRRAFFETPDSLVPADTDGVQDVYEWEADGEGTCTTPSGCLFLISSGQSTHPNFLFGVSESGDDVFIYTTDLLSPEDRDETPSVYDARVEGGFAAKAGRSAECLGEACQPAPEVPAEITPASSSFQGPGNVRPEAAQRKSCPKGRKARKQGGKTRCVGPKKQKKQKKAHKRANAKGRTAR